MGASPQHWQLVLWRSLRLAARLRARYRRRALLPSRSPGGTVAGAGSVGKGAAGSGGVCLGA